MKSQKPSSFASFSHPRVAFCPTTRQPSPFPNPGQGAFLPAFPKLQLFPLSWRTEAGCGRAERRGFSAEHENSAMAAREQPGAISPPIPLLLFCLLFFFWRGIFFCPPIHTRRSRANPREKQKKNQSKPCNKPLGKKRSRNPNGTANLWKKESKTQTTQQILR